KAPAGQHGYVLQNVDSLVGWYCIARCGVSNRTCPRYRLSTPPAVRPVVSSVRSTGYVAFPVRYIFSKLLTSGLKKFASVVRPSGIGRYICVDHGVRDPLTYAAKLKSFTSPFISSTVAFNPSLCS